MDLPYYYKSESVGYPPFVSSVLQQCRVERKCPFASFADALDRLRWLQDFVLARVNNADGTIPLEYQAGFLPNPRGTAHQKYLFGCVCMAH
jgi:hypothetical protein